MLDLYREPPSTLEHALTEVHLQLGEHVPTVSELMRYKPEATWFEWDPYGIHGIGHETRVLVLGEVLGRLLIQNGVAVDQDAMRWAATTHDVCRLEDGFDLEHGERSSLWVYTHMENVIPEDTMAHVSYLNQWHVPSDLLAPSVTPTLKAFKDADGLDRVRDHEWGGLSVGYLRYDVSRSLMIQIASTLYAESTTNQRMVGDQVQAVMMAAIGMGILRNE